jgi:hypothetical protein
VSLEASPRACWWATNPNPAEQSENAGQKCRASGRQDDEVAARVTHEVDTDLHRPLARRCFKGRNGGVKSGDVEKITFGFSGGNKGGPPPYRIQGSTFVIDFNCEQENSLKNPDIQIHSVFRNLRKDFALDMAAVEKEMRPGHFG